MNDLGDEWQYLLQAYLFGAFGSDEEFQNIVAQCFQNMLAQVEVATVDFAKKFTLKAIEFAELYVHKSELEYTTLRRTCSEYSEMHSLLSTAEKNAEIAKYYDALANAEGTEGEDLSQRIENVLYSLVNDYDDDELKVVQKIKYNEAVISARGDVKGSDQRTFLMLFSLVSKTLVENVEDSTKNEIFAFIKKVIDANMRASGYSEADIVNQILQYLNRMQPSDQLQYSMLRKYCTEFDQMSAVMMKAKNNIGILEFILKTVNVPVEQKNTFLKGYIDELIATPNQTEKDVYDEIAYNELIIRYEGEVETAKEVFSAEQTKKANNLNLIAEMIDWIYECEAQDINGQIRMNMFTLTKALQEQAVDAHVEDYRSRRKVTHNVTIGEYTTEVNFKREDEEYSKVASYFTGKRDDAIAALKNWKAFIGFGVGIASAVGAFFVGYWLFAVALIGAGYGAGVMLSNKSQIKHLEQKCAESIRSTSDILQQLFSEFSKYQAELDEYDSYYERIKNEFNKI